MQQHYTAIARFDIGVWIGWVEEVSGVNCQEPSRAELVETLRITLAEAIELNRADARRAAGDGYEELPVAP